MIKWIIIGKRWFERVNGNTNIEKKNSSKIRISQIRLNVNLWGHNRHHSTNRRSTCLSWIQWKIINNLLNAVFDKLKLSTNINSLSGSFIIREGKNAIIEWTDKEYEIIGSLMNPIYRIDGYHEPCDYTKNESMVKNCEKIIKQLED